jgi:hypothetical protein
MIIFTLPKEHKEYRGKNSPLDGWRLEPRVIPLKKSGVPTSPLDGVTAILIHHQIFYVFELNIFISHAITRAGFDSQLTLNCSLH